MTADEKAQQETKHFILKNSILGTIDGLKNSAFSLREWYKNDKKMKHAADIFADGIDAAVKSLEKMMKEQGT